MLANAVNICGAKFGNLFLCEDDKFTMVAMHGAPPVYAEWWRGNPTIRPGPQTGLARLIKTKQVNQTADLKAGAAYTERDPLRVVTVELAGARTLVDIPMLKDDDLVGAIVIYRQEVRPFSDKEIELLTNFAAQAVIAIENARLLNDLRESLQQQTASADVLRIISWSPGELDPVFSAILKNAASLCEATLGNLFLYNGEDFVSAAVYASVAELCRVASPRPFDPPSPSRGPAQSHDADEGTHSHCRCTNRASLYRPRSGILRAGRRRRRAHASRRSPPQRGHAGRGDGSLSPGGASVLGYPGRACQKLCFTGGDRHRERAAA
jgi:hypothetical protein